MEEARAGCCGFVKLSEARGGNAAANPSAVLAVAPAHADTEVSPSRTSPTPKERLTNWMNRPMGARRAVRHGCGDYDDTERDVSLDRTVQEK